MNEIEGVEGARNFFADLKRSCLSILEMNHINYFVQKDNDILNIVYYFSVPHSSELNFIIRNGQQ